MEVVAAEELGCRHELARRLRTVRAHVDLQALRGVARRVEQPDVGAALVDDALAVGRGMPRVEVLVIGVAAQVAAVRGARVEIPHILEIRQEPDPVAEPHRARHVSLELEPLEFAATGSIDPKGARGAAAVALPTCRIRRIAADHLGAGRSVAQVIHLPPRQELGQPALRVQRERAVVAEERLAVRADEEDPAFGRPAAHDRVGSEPGHAARRAALRRHQIHLGMLLVARDVGEPAAIRRERGPADLAQARGQPARCAAVRLDAPQVVVANENHVVAAEGRLPEVTSCRHEAR